MRSIFASRLSADSRIEPLGELLKVFADQVDQAEAIPVGGASHALVKIPAHETAAADLVESGLGGLLLHPVPHRADP